MRDVQYKKEKRPRYMASLWKLYVSPPSKPVHVPNPLPVPNWGQMNNNAARNYETPLAAYDTGAGSSGMKTNKQTLQFVTIF